MADIKIKYFPHFAAEETIGSLRNHDGDGEGGRRGQRRLKNELYFSYEYHDTRKSFSLFLSVKTISKINLEHSDKFEIEI